MNRPTLPGKAGYIETIENGKAVYRNAATGATEAQEAARAAAAAKAKKQEQERIYAMMDYLAMMIGEELPERENKREAAQWRTARTLRR